MRQNQRQLQKRVNQLIDGCLACAAFGSAYFLRARYPLFFFPKIEPFSDYWKVIFIIFPLAPMLLAIQGFYERPILPKRRETMWPLFKGCLLLVIGVIFVLFLLKMLIARTVVVLSGLLMFGLILGKEEALRRIWRRQYSQDQFKKRIILVGGRQETEQIYNHVKGSSIWPLEIIGEFDLETRPLAEFTECLHQHSINVVVFSARPHFLGAIEEAVRACEQEGVEVLIMADFFDLKIARISFDHFFGYPVLVLSAAPTFDWRIIAKRVLDVIGAGLFLTLVIPFFVIVSLAIRTTSPGPIFFRQRRSGLNGLPFAMLKFRTMGVNAEEQKKHLYARNEMTGPVFKVTNDPRVTPVGRFLRRYSIDELPQLINVIRGEMSLVGPRPLPLEEVRRFDDRAHRRRLSVKPGLTCLWQISGRNKITDFGEWVRLDLQYIDNWSLWLDFKILCLTAPAVLFGRGAK